MLSKIINLLHSGCKSPRELASQLGLSDRQIYRYIKEGTNSGQIVKVLPGFYGLHDVVPSFHEYISNSEFQNVWMSKKQQHNNTIQTDFYISEHYADLNTQNPESENKMNVSKNVSNVTKTMSLRDTCILILSVAKLNYSEFELKLAMNKLKEVHWYWIEQSNVEELVCDARERYMAAQQKYGNIEYPIPYFFGIIKRILISTVVKQQQASYRKFVMEIAPQKKAAGAESVVAATPTNALEPEGTPGNLDIIESAGSDVSHEWTPAKEAMRRMAEQHSIRIVSDGDIDRAIHHLATIGHYPDRVELAITYLNEHDFDGACYLLDNIQSPLNVEAAVNKNWRRYKKSLNPYKKEGSKTNIQKEKDDRYSNFYQLFPD